MSDCPTVALAGPGCRPKDVRTSIRFSSVFTHGLAVGGSRGGEHLVGPAGEVGESGGTRVSDGLDGSDCSSD